MGDDLIGDEHYFEEEEFGSESGEEEFDYNDEEVVEDYDPFVPNSKIDKKLQEELKETRKYKLE
jgi:hypothetical protein